MQAHWHLLTHEIQQKVYFPHCFLMFALQITLHVRLSEYLRFSLPAIECSTGFSE